LTTAWTAPGVIGTGRPPIGKSRGAVSPAKGSGGSAAKGRGQEPRRVHSDALSLGASLSARLAYDFRVLKRPLFQASIEPSKWLLGFLFLGSSYT
jgi:hypothetical protein